mmetsp:Transcript_23180/g.68466  ORF Transcript_23180/g.68466 Transcript_23180/m.68466 type:complete len:214 (+) Transcript_23180:586-1227(+)
MVLRRTVQGMDPVLQHVRVGPGGQRDATVVASPSPTGGLADSSAVSRVLRRHCGIEGGVDETKEEEAAQEEFCEQETGMDEDAHRCAEQAESLHSAHLCSGHHRRGVDGTIQLPRQVRLVRYLRITVHLPPILLRVIRHTSPPPQIRPLLRCRREILRLRFLNRHAHRLHLRNCPHQHLPIRGVCHVRLYGIFNRGGIRGMVRRSLSHLLVFG